MNLRSEEKILNATVPSDIFTMDKDTIKRQYDEYIEHFKPEAYNTIRNFVITQKITILYRKAVGQLENNEGISEYNLLLTDKEGQTLSFEADYVYDIKLGKMYVTEENIIFLVERKYKKYYENYIVKTKKFPKLNKDVWERVQYSFPDVSKYFETAEGDYVIIVSKPCKIYPLREILNYFGGRLYHEHVAAILNRLYFFECYMDIVGMQHNGITLDNLFFAPGREIEEGEDFTVDDMRIVGVFGGWFFTTKANEKISGMPKDVYDSLPTRLKKQQYSSFEVDALAIKNVARQLLGDATGEDLGETPEPMKNWLNELTPKRNPYDEYVAWEKAMFQSYGKRTFVDMDVSIK